MVKTAWIPRLNRGLAAGMAGGLGSVVVLWLAVEPSLRQAIALEGGEPAHSHAADTAAHHEHGDEVVSRTAQVVGGSVAAVLVAALLGLVFAVVYTKTRHRLPGNSAVGRSLVLGALAFAVMAVLPALKTPANPPGVGDPATVVERTLTYLLTILLGVLLIGACFAVARWVRRRTPRVEAAWTAAAAAAVGGTAAILLLAPGTSDAVPGSVPADLLWSFRVGSLGQLAAQYLAIGLVFGILTERADARSATPERRSVVAEG